MTISPLFHKINVGFTHAQMTLCNSHGFLSFLYDLYRIQADLELYLYSTQKDFVVSLYHLLNI